MIWQSQLGTPGTLTVRYLGSGSIFATWSAKLKKIIENQYLAEKKQLKIEI